jgi:hypothetical protein
MTAPDARAKTRGRPPVERRRIQMAMRITPELRDELVKRAEATGRSITQQMEMLLEQALLIDKLLGQTVVLQLSAERRLLLQQELYHAVHTLEAQARVAKAGSTRQRALTRRAADLRSVADQLA